MDGLESFVLRCPAPMYRELEIYRSHRGNTMPETLELVLKWFVDSELYYAPCYAASRFDDDVLIQVSLSNESKKFLKFLVRIGEASIENVCYTATLEFLAERSVREVIYNEIEIRKRA